MKKSTSQNSKLKRYIEWMSRGRRTGRIAYTFREWDLPEPISGAEWQPDLKFNAAEEILRDPTLTDVFKATINKGVEVVTSRE